MTTKRQQHSQRALTCIMAHITSIKRFVIQRFDYDTIYVPEYVELVCCVFACPVELCYALNLLYPEFPDTIFGSQCKLSLKFLVPSRA